MSHEKTAQKFSLTKTFEGVVHTLVSVKDCDSSMLSLQKITPLFLLSGLDEGRTQIVLSDTMKQAAKLSKDIDTAISEGRVTFGNDHLPSKEKRRHRLNGLTPTLFVLTMHETPVEQSQLSPD